MFYKNLKLTIVFQNMLMSKIISFCRVFVYLGICQILKKCTVKFFSDFRAKYNVLIQNFIGFSCGACRQTKLIRIL